MSPFELLYLSSLSFEEKSFPLLSQTPEEVEKEERKCLSAPETKKEREEEKDRQKGRRNLLTATLLLSLFSLQP